MPLQPDDRVVFKKFLFAEPTQTKMTACCDENNAEGGSCCAPSKVNNENEEALYTLKTVSPGDGQTFPIIGSGILMHYTAKLADGTIVDSSEGGEALNVNIGCGEVIRAWDLAIPKMTVGEKATLTTGSELAYGEQGVGPIPPGSSMEFDLELVGLTKAQPKKQNDSVVVDTSAIREFQERQVAKEREARDAALKVRHAEIDAMSNVNDLRAALKEAEELKETLRLLEAEKAKLEDEKLKEHERANVAVLERIQVREELGMVKIEVGMLKQELVIARDPALAPKPKKEVVMSHTWAEAGPLGMKLSMRPRNRKERSGLKVDSVKNAELPAGLAGLQLSDVNGTNIEEYTYDEALEVIKGAGRPLSVSFVKA